MKGTNWKYKLKISKRIRTQYSSQFLFRRKPSADSRPYFLLLLSLSPLKFLFLFLILSAFSPIFLICCLVKTCPNLPKLAQNCPNFPFLLFSHCFYKKMGIKKRFSLALVKSLNHWTEACLEFTLEPIKLPFTLSGVCSPNEGIYCSNLFEVFLEFSYSLMIYDFWSDHRGFRGCVCKIKT